MHIERFPLRHIKWSAVALLVIVVLSICGCPPMQAPPPAPNGDNGQQTDNEPQPQPDDVEPEPEPDDGGPESEPERDEPLANGVPTGTYIGMLDCEIVVTAGQLSDRNEFSPTSSVVIDEDENVVLAGMIATLGAVVEFNVGVSEESVTITSIQETPGAITLAGDYLRHVDCGDSCPTFRLNGRCDEIGLCALGTDCTDCGPLTFTGRYLATFKREQNGILYIVSVTSGDQEGFVVETQNCIGLMTN